MGAARTEETSKSTNLQDSFAMGSDGPYYKREKTFYGFDSARNETHAVSDSEDDERNNDDAKRLRDEGKSFYIDGCYRESVLRYTEAIRLHKESHSISFGDAILAALYGNRAAALMMTGAYEAAADDCHRALQCTVAMPATGGLDSGPVFRSKISCRMARALLKAGNVWEADKAFDSAIRSAKEALVLGQLNGTAEKILNGCIMDATLGLSDVKRYRDALDGATKIKADNADKSVSVTADRRNSVQLLMFINSALTVSPGSMELHERRVNALASLKRWAELGNHCERLAAEIVKTDGIFTDDLAPLNPFPDINAATSLKPDFFDKKPDNAAGPVALRLLSAKAVCEAVMRLPNGIVPLYLRSLRLEERYTEAAKAGACIEVYVANSKNRGTRGNAPLVWLSEEKDKLRRTMSWKEQGDTLFRNGEYECAATKYAACLSIDGDGSQYNQNALENDNAGGRLHAVLHCNRAACLMALKRYREAAKECTASLRIHTHYMKAILRRGRCFVMLRQFDEAVAEYERYIRLVDEARSSPQNVSSASNAACTFDRPIDVTDAEYLKAKQELADVRISSEPTATAARKQNRSQKKANQQQSCKDNNTRKATAKSTAKYPQEGPGRDNANAHKQHEQAGPGGANQRDRDGLGGTARKKTAAKKKEFSRGGNVPEGPSGNDGSQSQQKQQQQHQKQEKRQRQQQKQEQQRKPTPPPNLENVHCHYEVLGIAQTALISDIKKAYHKMCLKYHPDKNTEEGAADTFHRIKLAYEVLGDEKKRTYYDSRRR